MAIARVKTWTAGDTLTANDLNNEFNNLTNSALVEPFVATQPVDLNGQILILDADGDTLLDASTNNQIDVTINGSDDFRFSINTFEALTGSSILIDQGDLSIVQGNATFGNGRVNESDGGNVFSAAAVTVPTTGHTFTVTGTTTIASFSSTLIGTMFYVRFTGAGLNLTHDAANFIAPWGVDYRTVPNEVMCFLSLGSGAYTFWSMNGPKERTGQTIEHGSATLPAGFLEEDGTSYLRTDYPGLFQTIGTTYGSVDGTHFTVPLTKGLTVINQDATNSVITSASLNGSNAANLGGKGGEETHTLNASEVPVLTVRGAVTAGGATTAVSSIVNTANTTTSPAIVNVGGGSTHNTMPPWIAKKKYIRF